LNASMCRVTTAAGSRSAATDISSPPYRGPHDPLVQ
jgi:hypothetical protein